MPFHHAHVGENKMCEYDIPAVPSWVVWVYYALCAVCGLAVGGLATQ
jgi:hypothetical protein